MRSWMGWRSERVWIDYTVPLIWKLVVWKSAPKLVIVSIHNKGPTVPHEREYSEDISMEGSISLRGEKNRTVQ